MDNFALISFVIATASVAFFTYHIVQKMQRSDNATEEYFTGGRALSWPIVAGSLLLTNLSTEQLVGLNGDVFGDKVLVGVAWEALAAFAMIVTALIFLPTYLASGFTTTPAFLEKRFDKMTRSMVSGLFLFGYVTVLLPVVLYTGSLALKGMFDLEFPIWMIAATIGVLGSSYAIFGGLKSVAVSDTLNGIGLLIGGLAIPALALAKLGDGSFMDGLSTLFNSKPEYLAVLTQTNIDEKVVSVPWPTLLTGMMFIQVFYWSTNQVIVQRAMAAKSLAEGQKGVLFASAMKLIGPIMLCLPGIIALHLTDITMFGENALVITKQDQVYGAVVKHVLPDWSIGLFAAVLLGSILSSFNSALNSASTLFSLQFYKGYINVSASDDEIVKTGKNFGIILAVASIIIAPLLAQMESIFTYLQKVNGIYSVPIIAIFLLGVFTKHIPAIGAKVGMVVGFLLYAYFVFFPIENLHWLHMYFISFTWSIIVMLFIGYLYPKSEAEIAASEEREPAPVDMTPWKHAKNASYAIMASTVGIYLLLTLASN
ncbi:MAG: solute:sodium symporter family transporter [Candidatus Marinimicrobia bacterium]|nr:solute:sodium symporter family transporter [Candidatus Neomarinimicrobiota bacterium]